MLLALVLSLAANAAMLMMTVIALRRARALRLYIDALPKVVDCTTCQAQILREHSAQVIGHKHHYIIDLERYCARLEARIETLERALFKAGLVLPADNMPSGEHP